MMKCIDLKAMHKLGQTASDIFVFSVLLSTTYLLYVRLVGHPARC